MTTRALPGRKSPGLLGILAALAAVGSEASAASAVQDTVDMPSRGWIGILPSAPASERSFRLVVVDVYRNSPADLEGIVPGDWLIAVDGSRLTTYQTWFRSTSNMHVGQSIRVVVARNGDEYEVNLVADPAPEFVGPDPLYELEAARARFDSLTGGFLDFPPADEPWPWQTLPGIAFRGEFGSDAGTLTVTFGDSGIIAGSVLQSNEDGNALTVTLQGEDRRALESPPAAGGGGTELTRIPDVAAEEQFPVQGLRVEGTVLLLGGVLVRDLGAELGRYFGVESGVLVTDVLPGTPGVQAGFRPGDVIVSVEERPSASVNDLHRLLMELPTPIELAVVRRKEPVKIVYPRPQN